MLSMLKTEVYVWMYSEQEYRETLLRDGEVPLSATDVERM